MRCNESNFKQVIILTSIIGLGVYFPALMLYKKFERRGIKARILTIEKLLTAEKRNIFLKTKEAFKLNDKLAMIASYMPITLEDKFDEMQINKIFDEWKTNPRSEYICFSALWLPLLSEYSTSINPINLSCVEIDCSTASIWKQYREYNHMIKKSYKIWGDKLNYSFELEDLGIIPYNNRREEITIHGGGWDLGNFISILSFFDTYDYKLNLILNSDKRHDDISEARNIVIYQNDQDWNPLNDDVFPMLRIISSSSSQRIIEPNSYPAILNVISQSLAIISKPGGMSLVDSLITETPILFLDPIGKNEIHNQQIFEKLKLGMTFEEWKNSNFSNRLLQNMNKELKAIKCGIPDLFKSIYEDIYS